MSGLNTTWVLLLAAGASCRFGSPKALAPWQNGTLISHAIAVSKAVADHRVLAVIGADAALVRNHVQGIHSTVNNHWENGMGRSIATGIRAIMALGEPVRAVIVLPVDQPLVSPQHLRQLAEASFRTEQMILTANAFEKGPPACLPFRYFPQALAFNGQKGLKSILTETNHTTLYNPHAFLDADTPQALKHLAESAAGYSYNP